MPDGGDGFAIDYAELVAEPLTAPPPQDTAPPTEVSEPGTLAVLGLGLAAFRFVRRRRGR